ncbi:thioredoxin domain-containing protein [Campylobacter canadensis]|uniref:Thioredoxin domain-containing protein n=1 Tax=Campylobacter canadensis TaxID=449520 RepID=A0ABS7WRC2_9BACT|nr:hypothetical protein [Campylobacter canadensis]MBZ7986629.1 thioredoxin domain-containing protein [Campylobacter canadensis]MBZ7997665.1 thioredoxin domain-containing protein [Campylobacter canadensis]
MRKIFIYLALCCALFANEAKYYELKSPLNNKENSLIEIFSYSCIHCYAHFKEKTLEKIHSKLPNLNIEYKVVKSWDLFANRLALILAYAKYKDEQNNANFSNGLYAKIIQSYFNEVFIKKNNFNNNVNNFEKIGLNILKISKKQLEKFKTSNIAQGILNDLDKSDAIANEYGTPSFIVNGKYIINLNAVHSVDDFVNIINEINEK